MTTIASLRIIMIQVVLIQTKLKNKINWNSLLGCLVIFVWIFGLFCQLTVFQRSAKKYDFPIHFSFASHSHSIQKHFAIWCSANSFPFQQLWNWHSIVSLWIFFLLNCSVSLRDLFENEEVDLSLSLSQSKSLSVSFIFHLSALLWLRILIWFFRNVFCTYTKKKHTTNEAFSTIDFRLWVLLKLTITNNSSSIERLFELFCLHVCERLSAIITK